MNECWDSVRIAVVGARAATEDNGECDSCRGGKNLTQCKHCVDSNCASCGLWWPTGDVNGGCDGSCTKENM